MATWIFLAVSGFFLGTKFPEGKWFFWLCGAYAALQVFQINSMKEMQGYRYSNPAAYQQRLVDNEGVFRP